MSLSSSMYAVRRFLGVLSFVSAIYCLPVHAMLSNYVNAKGDTVFSPQFLQDYEAAGHLSDKTGSAEPFMSLLNKYHQPEEIAELELAVGVLYNQRTGLVDPAKAVEHLSKALQYRFDAETYVQISMWRGNSYEQLKQYKAALKDYLRGLIACSYHALPPQWPEIKEPTVPVQLRSADRENEERRRDYSQYRQNVNLQRALLRHRYELVEAVKRVQPLSRATLETIQQTLLELTPDKYTAGAVVAILKSENKQPIP